MVDYIPIPDTEIAPESPVTSVLIHKLRDNPLAIAEGSPGAPKMQVAAIGIAAGEILASYPSEMTIVSWSDWTKNGPGVVCGGITGTIRIKFSILIQSGSLDAQLFFNGAEIGPEVNKSTPGLEIFPFDYTLIGPGLIELRTKSTPGLFNAAGDIAIYSTETMQFTREVYYV